MTGSCKICLLCSSCGRTKRKNTTEGDLKVNVLLFFFYCISLSRKWSINCAVNDLEKKKTFPDPARQNLFSQDFSSPGKALPTLPRLFRLQGLCTNPAQGLKISYNFSIWQLLTTHAPLHLWACSTSRAWNWYTQRKDNCMKGTDTKVHPAWWRRGGGGGDGRCLKPPPPTPQLPWRMLKKWD